MAREVKVVASFWVELDEDDNLPDLRITADGIVVEDFRIEVLEAIEEE